MNRIEDETRKPSNPTKPSLDAKHEQKLDIIEKGEQRFPHDESKKDKSYPENH